MAKEKLPNWKQENFYGGYSDDKFLGIKNSFRYAKGVEIRKNPKSLTLAYDTDKDTSTTIDSVVYAMVTINSTGDIIAFGGNGKIWRKTAGAGAWALVYTDTGSAKILNGFEYNDYLYWFTADKVHRIAVSSIDADWSGTVTEDYKTFTNANANAHPAIEYANKMYVGDGSFLAELDSLMVWTANKIILFADEEIRAITFGGAMMRLFTRKSNLIDYGAKYYWNGTDEAYNERVIISETIHTAISEGGADYVIAGKIPHLYLSSGYDWVDLMALPGVADNQSCSFAPNAIDYFNNLLTFGSAEAGTNSMGRGAWTFGKLNKNYPNSLNFDYPTSNDNATDTINCIHQSNGVLYIGWKNASTYGIDIVNTAKYRLTGELHSRIMYGSDVGNVKDIGSIRTGFGAIAAGEKIEIFLKKNEGSWSVTSELDIDYDTVADRSVYGKEKDVAANIGDFNMLETKIILTAGTSQLTTPELMELNISFDNDILKGD